MTEPNKEKLVTVHTNQIDACEFETEPFMVFELDAIDHYHGQIGGIPDCFAVDTAGFANLIREFGPDYLEAHITYLHDWKQYIDELYDTLRKLGGDDLNKAAARFICQETTSWGTAECLIHDAALTALGARRTTPVTGVGGAWAPKYTESWNA